MTTLVTTAVLSAALSFLIALWMLRPRTAKRSVVRRLDVIHRAHREEDVELVRPEQKLHTLSDSLNELADRFGFSHRMARLILHAGRSETVGVFLLLSATLAVFGVTGGLLLRAAAPVCLAAGGVLGVAPAFWLRRLGVRRLERFNTALPDAIDLMARALRAGHSSGSSIEIIAEQSCAPLSEEFAHCFQQQKFGIPFREAMVELGERVPSRDLHFLITAILVQKETGGDLTQILERATEVIRERIRIEGEVRSYTAQGRLTGWILAALPLVMLLMINVMTPGYTHVLFTDPLGHKLLYAGAGLIATGAFLIRRIVDIKV